MTRTERLLLYFACVCMFVTGLTLTAGAQSIPAMLNQDPAYWYKQYVAEKSRADGLAKSGDVAIRGLQATVTSANQTITDQNNRLKTLTARVNAESSRANRADSLLAPFQQKVRRYEGGTWAGRQLRKIDRSIKYVGYGAVGYGLLRAGFKLLIP